MMIRAQYWILLVLMALLSACDEDNTQELVPTLSHDSLTMTVGEVAEIVVNNAGKIEAKAGTPIIDIESNANVVLVKALSSGNTRVFINADGHRLECDVTIEDVRGGDLTENDEYDFSAELNDETTRFVSPELSLRYDDCGVLIAMDNQHITMESLDMGDVVEFRYSGVLLSGDEIENAQLSVNGKIVNLQSARVERLNNQGVWINMKTSAGAHIVLVVTDC